MSMLLDALSWIGDSLDKPGRAARGILSGNFGEGLAAIPFSDSLGITDHANRTSGNDLLRSLGVDGGDMGGFAAEIATDPLMFAGAGLGRMLGRGASEAAVARGPRYGTGGEDINRMLAEFSPMGEQGRVGRASVEAAPDRVKDLLSSPDSARILSEISPDSKILGAGKEGLAFTQPGGGVVRVGGGVGEQGRPLADGLLQPTSTLDIGATARAERMPLADRVGDAGYWSTRNPETMLTQKDVVDQTLAKSGIKFNDRHTGNLGVVNDRPVVIDPGAVDATRFTGPRASVTQSGEPSRLMSALLNSIGADDAVRKAYASGLSGPSFGRKLGTYGGLLGVDAGILGRLTE